MTYRLWLLIAALVCAAAMVLIDFSWVDVKDPHVAGWLGLSLFFYMAREVKS